MTIDEYIVLLEAMKAGKPIELRSIHHEGWRSNWADCVKLTPPNFALFEYRAKRVPVECWANVLPDGSLAYHQTKESAESRSQPGGRTILMREVIE